MIKFECAKMLLSLKQSALYVKISMSEELLKIGVHLVFTILRLKLKESSQFFFVIFGPLFCLAGRGLNKYGRKEEGEDLY